MCNEVNTFSRVLYREVYQGGDDSDGAKPNGVVTTLVFWSSQDWREPDHFTLTTSVMKNREVETKITLIPNRDTEANVIRYAIQMMDRLINTLPMQEEIA